MFFLGGWEVYLGGNNGGIFFYSSFRLSAGSHAAHFYIRVTVDDGDDSRTFEPTGGT